MNRRVKVYHKTDKGIAALARAQAKQTPLQRAARKAVSHALEKGKLLKPLTCSRCSSSRSIQAHHYRGYNKECWLDVEWLCAPCHKVADTGVTYTAEGLITQFA